ncbi:hypothetical protein [Psychroflexus sediminis]|uniref:Uncharacterized protein n=1 Tax=Psychroflexus sediminis TaxID=470826 RepID=A0A1G7WBH9_9FLAO|nr:hypothetical protein [Psychroflexus sediminis]SDG68470.1 hypothetical protein SAMN04488027_10574 [Psychroflexus sediminis]
MRIKYFKKRLYLQLILGLLFISCCIYSILYSDDISIWIGYTYLVVGIFHIADFFKNNSRYIIIENGSIEEKKLFGANTKMGFDEIQTIEKLDGNYILKSETKKLVIKTDLIDNTSLLKLMEILKNIDLPPEKNYFIRFKTQN